MIPIEELRIKTSTYYALQKIRIQAQLRIKAFVRDEVLSQERSDHLHFWLDDLLIKMEERIKGEVVVLLTDVPIYQSWMKDIKGVGPCISGSLVSGIKDIGRFNHVSALWKYCGQHVVNGEAPRRQHGKKFDWNPFLRMTVYKLTDSFVRQSQDKSLYRRLYDKKKAFYQEKYPEWKTGGSPHPTRKTKTGESVLIHTKGHLHDMAKRYAGKIFLQHLWVSWRKLEKLPVTRPWVFEHGDGEHTDYIPVEEAV